VTGGTSVKSFAGALWSNASAAAPGRGRRRLPRGTSPTQSTLRRLPAPENLRPNSEAVDAAPVYFVLHIPKTAGQTIQTHFAEHCAPGVYWQPRRRLRFGSRMRATDFPGSLR
jgi:hypothetical protein